MMAPAPLLVVCDFNGHGGTQTQVLALLAELDRSRFDPHLATLSLDPALGRRLEDLDVPVTDLGLTAALSLRTGRAVTSLASALRRAHGALVHGFLYHGNLLAAASAQIASVPYATSVRNLELWKRPHELLLSRWAHAGAAAVTFNARHVRDVVCRREAIPGSKARVIENGLMPRPRGEVSQPSPWPPGAAPRLVCVASLTKKKDHGTLLDAFARILPAHREAALALVGDGPERRALEAHCRRAGILSRVVFAGRRPDTPSIIAEADLLALSSVEEGMPNVILEAMAAGVPQVATAVGGTPEALEEGGTGFLVPPGDPALMAERMLRILSDDRLRRAFAARGPVRFAERFAAARMAREHEGLYGEILGAWR